MRDAECVAFLQWALPRLRFSWTGFRKVRRSTISCRITSSRFWRDRAVFEALRDDVLPSLGEVASAWSAGCASGEEPYSLVLAASEAGVGIRVVATDADPVLLERARTACYRESSLRDLPLALRARAFEDGCLRPVFRDPVELLRGDIRSGAPDGQFDLVLCRNLAFTYFAADLQLEVCRRLVDSLRPGGALVVGAQPLADARHRAPPVPCERRGRPPLMFAARS